MTTSTLALAVYRANVMVRRYIAMCFTRVSSRFSALLLFVLVPALSLADDSKSQEERLSQMTFEEILNIKVVTPSKVSEFARKSPNVVSVYTAREIELFGGRDFGEILSRLVSVQPYENLQAGRVRVEIRGDQPWHRNSAFPKPESAPLLGSIFASRRPATPCM